MFSRNVVLLVLLPTQKKRKWVERAWCLTTKTSGSLLLPHLSAPAVMEYRSIVYAWKIQEIKYESRKLMLQDRCCSSPLNSKREKHPTFRGFIGDFTGTHHSSN